VVITTPTLLVTPSSPTLCANNFNGSTNTVSINVSGATSYSWTGINGIITNTAAGAVISATAIPGSAVGSGSVTGYNGTCSTTATFSVANIPNPIITVPSAVLCGPATTLTANGATNYSWSPVASLSSSTGSSVVANPVITTVYSIIGSSLNCNSATQTATVVAPVSLSVSIASSTNQICSGGTINYTATASGGIGAPYTYSWSNGATGSVVPISENTGGIYSYNVIIRDASACASNSATAIQIVTVVPSPVLTTANAGICSGQSANLVVNGASSYSWSPSTALSSTLGSAVIANPSSTTVYSVTGTNLFCTSTASLTVSVVPYPNSNVTSPNQQICYGTSTQINATNAQVYNWVPNYAISNTTGPNVVVSPSVNTTYTLTSYNSNGTLVCSETKMMPIVVVPQVTPAIINNQSICLGNETSLAADGGNTYIWAPANSLNNASTSVVIASPSVTTIYTVDVSNNGSCGKTATVLVKVNPNPQVFAGRDTTFNLDEPMFINATGTGTLTWLSGEGIFCKDCPETKINATQSGCYVIETVNEFGCKASDEVCIEVTTNSGIFIPNSFTPNDDGLNDVFLVQGYSLSDVKLEIFDRWGEKLFSSNDQKLGWNGTYKGTACKSDVYVYKLSYKGLDGKRQFKTGHVSISR
jgi:gliding motility-associated-like protein